MRIVGSIRLVASVHTIVVTLLAVTSTWFCLRFGLTADFPLTLVATAIIFPIVFSIGGAYKRREAALAKYASMKAHGRAIYFASRDWVPESDEEIRSQVKRQLFELFQACRELFSTPTRRMEPREKAVYRTFSDLSRTVKAFRGKGLPSGEASRCNQYLSKMIVAFEDVKHIYQYRTPRTLRAYSKVFIYLLAILYGPYFAEQARDYAWQLAYVMPVLFSVIMASLDNIQNHLENPFDQVGEDDVYINAEKFIERLEL